MKKIAMTLVMAGLLAGGACSRPKEEPAQAKTPDPNLPARMEKQQNAISRASEHMKKEDQRTAPAEPSATPSPSPP